MASTPPRLWSAYEAKFKAAHEESLAYRYLPANDAERALVVRYFPPVTFAAKPNKSDAHALQIDCDTLHYAAWNKPVAWSAMTALTAEDKAFRGKVLTVQFSAAGSTEKVELPLAKLADKEEAILAVIGHYYTRVLAAKQHIADTPEAPRSA
jgi:hypothetical protein